MIRYQPKQIIFINDKRSNLIPVEKYCQKAGVPFTGLRYGYLDKKVANFNQKAADMQWAHFGKILSDRAVLKELGSYCAASETETTRTDASKF